MMKRTRMFAVLAFLLVFFDLAKFYLVGEPNIINWHSFVHPAWVFTGFGSLAFASYWPSTWVMRALFWIFFLVFLAALLNQYISFNSVLTYNCMLFNTIFVAIYFIESKREET